MAKNTSPSETVTDAPSATPNAVGFTKTSPARLAEDARAVVGIFKTANEEKGDRKVRAITNARTLSAMLLADCERDATLAATARGTRIGVEVESKLRGEKTRSAASLPVLDVLRALTFGGLVQGGGRLV